MGYNMKNQPITQTSIIGKSWALFLEVCAKRSKIMMPFTVMALIELIAIGAIFVFIQPPFTKFSAPIVLRFFGEKFLHYPFNLILTSQLFNYFQNFSAIVIGTFVVGMTISAVADYNQTKDFSFKPAAKKTLFKYINLVIISVLVFFIMQFMQTIENKILIKILMKGPSFLGIASGTWKMIFLFVFLFSAALVQSMFVFTQTAIMIDNKNFITAIFKNLVYVLTNIFSACFLVIIPLMAYLPIVLLKSNLFELMKRSFPEISFVIMIMGVFLTLFINLVITITTTKAYLLIREKRK
ncbi:MAG: hypothetical protein KJ915_01570 [Candidatus Omnitrophica bacterium]|nr:hypothetical protein [Candidatus Omnitrophota bacterium]